MYIKSAIKRYRALILNICSYATLYHDTDTFVNIHLSDYLTPTKT